MEGKQKKNSKNIDRGGERHRQRRRKTWPDAEETDIDSDRARSRTTEVGKET